MINISIMSHKVSYWWISRTQYITSIGLFYNVCGDFTWRVSFCEELVGVLEISIVHVVVSRQFFTGKDMKICFGIEIN